MTRRLPWATGADAGSSTKPTRTPVQRARHKQPISSEDDLASTAKPHQTSAPAKSPAKPRVRKRQKSRTPSTSPPPGPPTAELMHEGYHADDAFMLVEDEFQSVAQSFTRHLHHAEYVRLKKRSRVAPLPAFTKSPEGMLPEGRKRLEAKDIRERQNAALKGMISKANRASPDNEEEPQGHDPWKGTSLAGLMTENSTQKRTALVGLEQISSSTRAAKGFSRGEGESPKKRDEKRSILEIYGGKSSTRRTTSPTPGVPAEDSEDDEVDDLDAPFRVESELKDGRLKSSEIQEVLSKAAHIGPSVPSNKLTALPLPPNSRSEHVTTTKIESKASRPSSKLSASSLRRTIDCFDDFHEADVDDFSSRSEKDVSTTGKTRAKVHAQVKDKKSRLDDIPTFLV